jgi:hypothetical protein
MGVATISMRVLGGFLAFGACSAWGLYVLWRGITNDTTNASGHELAPRGWFIGMGMVCQLLSAWFVWFAWKQGFFAW